MQEVPIKQAKSTLKHEFNIILQSGFSLHEGIMKVDINYYLLLIDTKKEVVKCRLEQVDRIVHLPPSRKKQLKGRRGAKISFHHPDNILLWDWVCVAFDLFNITDIY